MQQKGVSKKNFKIQFVLYFIGSHYCNPQTSVPVTGPTGVKVRYAGSHQTNRPTDKVRLLSK